MPKTVCQSVAWFKRYKTLKSATVIRSGRSTWENSHIQRKLARPSASLVIINPPWGLFRAPSRFLMISSKPMQLSSPNLQYPLSQQFCTLCCNFKIQDIIGRSQMTSEWHDVPPISNGSKSSWAAPPRTAQFLSYNHLSYMNWWSFCRATKLLSRSFELLNIWKNFQHFQLFSLKVVCRLALTIWSYWHGCREQIFLNISNASNYMETP